MTIVCGTDLSDNANQAVKAAFALARLRGDRELVITHVLDRDADDHDAAAATARDHLASCIAAASTDRVPAARIEMLAGPAVESLVATTETEGGDLLVVSSRGHGDRSLMSLGGTSGGVVSSATIPVLIVRDAAPLEAWAAGRRALRVMIGLDESASCDPAIGQLHRLRALGPVDVVAGHVYYADETARRYGLRTQSMVDADPTLEQFLRRDLERRLGDLPGAGTVEFRFRAGLGRIGDHLLEIADAAKVDLIVVGTRQKGGIGRLSSVSSVLIHDAKQSVWCVPTNSQLGVAVVPRFKTVVVATDLSEFGNHAVPYAFTLVGARGGDVHLVHVRDEEHEGRDPAETERELLALTPPGQAGVTVHAHVIAGDDAAVTIGEAAERLGADVVVIASRARSGLSRVLLGSVADKVLRTCRRPVLILRPPTE
ncbi:MAG: universal stress protein [Myxococcales bacterium]|nr:universal stress protein [Myxococcales bacterium]